jgi:hypothetical protein
VVFRADPAAVRLGSAPGLHGAEAVAATFKGRAQVARPALVDGELGIVVAPRGRVLVVLRPIIAEGRIIDIEAVADAAALGRLTVGELPA